MCYNCGCQMPDDDMGQGHAGEDGGKSITTKTFQVAADSQGITIDEAKRYTYETLKHEMGESGNAS